MSVQETLEERGSTHGEFSEHAQTCQSFKYVMKQSPNWDDLTDVDKEALEMIVHKIARILCGNPRHADHWHDIAGYATLAERDCK